VRRLLAILCLLAAPALAAERPTLTIGYLGLKKDPRWQPLETYANLVLRGAVNGADGAAVAMRDARIIGRALGVKFAFEVRRARDLEALTAAFEELRDGSGARFFLVDLPAPMLADFAARTRGQDVLLFNVSAAEDELRGAQCQPHLLHVIPSHRMYMDAIAQFLADKGWRNVLLLTGPTPEDAKLSEVFKISNRRFGGRVVEERGFVPTNDPRAREKNNIRLLTTGIDYDVIVVTDHRGEFSRYVPYNSVLPRPVIGMPLLPPTVGLVPAAWHWASERFGSPQLNQRFERQVKHRRKMHDVEWASWAAVRSLLEAMMRAKSTEFEAVKQALLSPEARLDVYKGVPANFRSWNGQMRQPILLATHNAVVTYAPLPKFLHARNQLDTLGVDEPNTDCSF